MREKDLDSGRGAKDRSSSISKMTLKGLKVLLVEDNPDLQMLFSATFKLAGASSVLAKNGKESLSVVKSQNFDAILMDIQMPLMDGYEAMRRLREGGYKGPILALTAHALSGERDSFISQGFDDFIAKPDGPFRIIAKLKEICSRTERQL